MRRRDSQVFRQVLVGHLVKCELLDVEKVAEELGVHVDMVRKWIREKQLRAVKSGQRGGYRIRRSDLNEFLRKRETIQDDDIS